MRSAKLSSADRHDTWDPGWEDRLARHLRSAGFPDAWRYVASSPGRTYPELAEALAASGGFGVAPIQVERLQVRDTPEADLQRSLRDSLARQLQGAFRTRGWRRGPYWESRALGALGSWSAMWSSRVDVAPLKHRLFELAPPEDWLPADEQDPYLLSLVPDRGGP